MVTAEIKNKFIKELGYKKKYIYYHCTKRTKSKNCTQKSVRLEDLEQQILDILSNIEIKP